MKTITRTQEEFETLLNEHQAFFLTETEAEELGFDKIRHDAVIKPNVPADFFEQYFKNN